MPKSGCFVERRFREHATPDATQSKKKNGLAVAWAVYGFVVVRRQIRGTSTEVLDGSSEMFKSEFPQNRRPTVEPCWSLSHFFCRWESPLLQDISRVFGVSNDLTTALGSLDHIGSTSMCRYHVTKSKECISCTRGWLLTQRGWPRWMGCLVTGSNNFWSNFLLEIFPLTIDEFKQQSKGHQWLIVNNSIYSYI